MRAFAFTGEIATVDRAAAAAPGVRRLTDLAVAGGRLSGWFSYPAAAADLDPRPARGRYETLPALGAAFRLETAGGEAGLGAGDLGRAVVEVIDDGPAGDVFRLQLDDSWGVVAFTLELVDGAGAALAGDELPMRLDLARFEDARVSLAEHDRFAGTRVGFGGRLRSLEEAR